MKGGEHLGHHQRRGGALRQPCGDQFRAGLRQAAPQRGDGEAEHTGQKYIPGAVDMAEPAAGDDQRRIGNEVDRDDSLDLRRARMQFDCNGRDCDVDDEGIDTEHELRGDDDREHPPAAR
jgi:hypothetical protein